MAAVLQKNGFFLTKQQLHTAVLNPQGSKEFLKKIVPMSVSFILHQRVQLDEKNFQTRTHDGIKYKVFKPKLQNFTLQNVRDWVNSALQALDKNYLREIYLVLAKVDDPTVIFESYKFQFKYMGDDVIDLNIPLTEKGLVQSTDSFLRAIDSLKEHTKYSEEELDIKMAITYYEDVTPLDYNPPFFVNKEETAAVIRKSLENQSRDYLLLGLLKTGHHVVKCRGKGEVFSMNRSVSSSNWSNQKLEDSDNHKVPDNEQYSNDLRSAAELLNNQNIESQSVLETELQDTEETEPQNPQSNISMELFDRRNTVTPTVSEISEKEISDVTIDEIQCVCKISVSFEHVGQIMCSMCFTFQHCVCLGYLSEKDILNPYVCPLCDDGCDYTPMKEQKKKMMSIYRLAVAVAYFTESFPDEVVANLPTEMKEWVTTKMKEYKVVKKQDDGQYTVNMELLRSSYIKGIFCNSFTQKRKAISDDPTLDEEGKEIADTEPKKKRCI